jgi:hypothetical protein
MSRISPRILELLVGGESGAMRGRDGERCWPSWYCAWGGSRGRSGTSTSLPLFPFAWPSWCPEAAVSAAVDGRTAPVRSSISREKMAIFL